MARDPERRRISREAQNARRKLQRRVARLRKLAKSEKNAKVKTAYQREAKNLTGVIKRSAFKRGESLNKVSKKLERLISRIEEPTLQKNRNLYVQNEMRRALDGQNTIFGSGQEGRAKIRAFYMAFSDDWVSKEGDTLTNILQAHPGMDIYDLYKSSFIETGFTGKTWEEFIADYLGINYSNIDTSSSAFKNQMNEQFDSLDSPIQKELAVQYNRLH